MESSSKCDKKKDFRKYLRYIVPITIRRFQENLTPQDKMLLKRRRDKILRVKIQLNGRGQKKKSH